MNKAIAQVVATSALVLSVMTSQAQVVRSRSLVAWGENILGLNKAPSLPAGVKADDVDAVYSAELVNGVLLRTDIEGYSGPRFIMRGAGGLAGDPSGSVSGNSGPYVNFLGGGWSPNDYYSKYTTWDTSLLDRSWNVDFGRMSFGFLNGVILRQPTPVVAIAPSFNIPVASYASAGGLGTITTQTPHGFSVGTKVVVKDVEASMNTPLILNGNTVNFAEVLDVPSPTSFVYATLGIGVASTPSTTGFVGFLATTSASTGGVIRSANETTITTGGAHNIPVGAWIKVSGLSDASFNGVFQVKSKTPNSITYPNVGNNGTAGGSVVVMYQPVDSDLGFFGDTSVLPRDQNGNPITQVTDPDHSFVKVASSSTHTLALRSNGTVQGFLGDNFYGETTIPAGVDSAVDVAAGDYFSAALLKDGKVVVWGMDAYGLLSIPAAATNVISLKVGSSHLVALRGDGTVVAWGNTADGRVSVPSGAVGVRKIAVGRSHTLALKQDGTVLAWGYNGDGQVSIPPGLANVIDIAAGGDHSLALVSREKPTLGSFTIREQGAPTVFNPATDFTDRGRTLSISVALSNGATPVQYRWRRNGNIVSGATNSTYNLLVGTNDTGAIRIDVEASNAFGSDAESVSLNLATRPFDVVAQLGTVASPVNGNSSVNSGVYLTGTFTELGKANGAYLAMEPANPSLLAFEVSGKGNPAPTVTIYKKGVSAALVPASVLSAATSSSAGTLKYLTSLTQEESTSGSYLVVVANQYGGVTNTIDVSIFQPVAAPTISSFTVVGGNGSSSTPYLGYVPAGSNSVLTCTSDYPSYVTFQWFKDGDAITKGTNSTLTIAGMNVAQLGVYSLTVKSPLNNSQNSAEAANGIASSSYYKPVLPIKSALSKSSVSGQTSETGTLDLTLSGSLTAEITVVKIVGGVSTPASGVVSLLGRPWTQSGNYLLNLDSVSGGPVTLKVQVPITTANTGTYQVQVRHLTAGGAEVTTTPNATIQRMEFSVIEIAPSSVVHNIPTPLVSGGGDPTTVNGDLVISAGANSTVDLGTYLQVGGFPVPSVRWEREVNSSWQSVSGQTNKSFSLKAIPTNAGRYRLVVTNGLTTSLVSKTVDFQVDRVLLITNSAMVFPNGSIELPIFLVGFGDETAVSFTYEVPSAFLVADSPSEIFLTLDDALSATTSLASKTDGTTAGQVAAGAQDAANKLVVSGLISKKDITTAFPAGTNRLGTLKLKARTATQIGVIRGSSTRATGTASISSGTLSAIALGVGGSGYTAPPKVNVVGGGGSGAVATANLTAGAVTSFTVVQPGTGYTSAPDIVIDSPNATLLIPLDVKTSIAPSDAQLPLKLALTNAVTASVRAPSGSLLVLADSVEGDVNGDYSVNALDVTSTLTALTSKVYPDVGGLPITDLGKSRFDCAPRVESGDKVFNLADFVQVGRYAAKLDTIKPTADPLLASGNYQINGNRPRLARQTLSGPPRKFRFGWADFVTGQEVLVPVVLSARGDENAMAFNVEFSPSSLQYLGHESVSDTSVLENRTDANAGRVGLLLWKPAGSAIDAGNSVVTYLKFKVLAVPGRTSLRFSAVPLDALIATVQAQAVPDVEFEEAQLSIVSQRRVVGGAVVSQTWSGKTWSLEIQPVDSAGNTVSAKNRTLSILSSDRMDADANQWVPAGVKPTVSPTGNLLLPFTIDPNRTSQFFRIQED